MRRDALPSLRALAVFETAARYENFTATARELNVSQAAVSKTIQHLESELGCKLFTRSGRTIRLTRTGRDLYERARSALDYLEEGCAHIRAGDKGRAVTVAANTAVSHFWLGPRLRRYADHAPSDPVRLITSDRDSDLTDESNDLAVLYGYEQRMGWSQARLFHEELVPVAARSYLGQADLMDRLPLTSDTIAGLSVLDYELQGPGWTNFGTWLEWAGVEDHPRERHRIFSSYALAVDAMLDGEGLALASRPLLPKLLGDGEVVEVSNLRLRTERAYFLAFRPDRKLSDPAQRLFQWLIG
jgi:DNA-binding transcriptional LysR family regulator